MASSDHNNGPLVRPHVSAATEEENAEDFMGIHKIEIIFHEAGTTKNLINAVVVCR